MKQSDSWSLHIRQRWHKLVRKSRDWITHLKMRSFKEWLSLSNYMMHRQKSQKCLSVLKKKRLLETACKQTCSSCIKTDISCPMKISKNYQRRHLRKSKCNSSGACKILTRKRASAWCSKIWSTLDCHKPFWKKSNVSQPLCKRIFLAIQGIQAIPTLLSRVSTRLVRHMMDPRSLGRTLLASLENVRIKGRFKSLIMNRKKVWTSRKSMIR